MTIKNDLYFRQSCFDKIKRVVVKVGSQILTGEQGINVAFIASLARELSFLQNSGREVLLVCSGAIAMGRHKAFTYGSVGISVRQAIAAIGQPTLMRLYSEAFNEYHQNIAQILLVPSDFDSRDKYMNLRNTILTLFQFDTIPIVNENDALIIEEPCYDDENILAVKIANLIEADIFIWPANI